MKSLIGQIIDNYRILDEIGRGAMGVVYKAMDIHLEKIVALKMMGSTLAEDDSFLKKFRTEAKALARLENPHIIQVYTFRDTEFGFLIVMEYVDGTTLSDEINKGRSLPIDRVLFIFKQILDAISHAHQAKVIHCDIKPKNIMVTKHDKVKVMDFGIAQLREKSDATVTKTRAGTLCYMSPEQATKGLAGVDNRSDIYSLGITFYEMLTGRTPFEKDCSDFTILNTIVKGKIPAPTKYNENIPGPISDIIMKALEKNPEKRFQSVEQMQKSIEYFESKERVSKALDGQKDTHIIQLISQPDVTRIIVKLALVIGSILLTLILVIFLVIPKFLGDNSHDNVLNINNLSGLDSVWNQDFSTGVEFGSLSITSTPTGANIFIENKAIGKTPLTLDSLHPGQISLRLEKSGYEVWERHDINIEVGIKQDINVKLSAFAYLTLGIEPKGLIKLDGKVVSNNDRLKVLSGKYEVIFENPDIAYPAYSSKRVTINLQPRENKNLTCYFEKYLSITTVDEFNESTWAVIMIDGKDIGQQTPMAKERSPALIAGEHSISVKRSGYQTIEGTQKIVVEPTLKKEETVIHLKFRLKRI